MHLVNGDTLKEIIVVGDRVLVKPKELSSKTNSGLFLPPGVKEKEQVRSGYIMKAGPGYPIPFASEDDQPWKDASEKTKYVPLQAKEGDLAIYLQSGSYEIEYEGEKYVIVPQSSILLLEREGGY